MPGRSPAARAATSWVAPTGIKFAGALAVDMFFVISGFLIAASLERNSAGGYLVARALRNPARARRLRGTPAYWCSALC